MMGSESSVGNKHDDSLRMVGRANTISVNPLVSVILPVYNGETYLAEAIDSILAQTFKNFELLIIDDGSEDSTREILYKYASLDARVKVVARTNRGLANTLNDLIDLASGDWIARMDHDDIALPHRLARQLQWLEETGSDLAGSWFQYFGTSDKRTISLKKSDAAIKMEMLFVCPFAHPTVMMRTSLVRQLRYDAAWDKAEDYDLWVRAAQSGWRMTNIPEVLLLYRVHDTQISQTASEKQHELGLRIKRRYWEYFATQNNIRKDLVEEIFKIFDGTIFKPDMNAIDEVFRSLLQGQEDEVRDVIRYHISRLYMQIAAVCPDAWRRWQRFFPDLPRREIILFQSLLWTFRLFRVQPGKSRIFNFLKWLHRVSRITDVLSKIGGSK